MIDRLMGALLSVSSWTGGLVWTTAWQSTLWLAVGMVAARIWRRRAGRAHLLLILSTSAAVVSPLLTESVRRMEWGVLPPPPAVPEDSPVVVVAPSEPTREVRAAEPGDVSFDELPQESREPATNQAPEPDREEQVATLPQSKTEPDPEPAKPAWTAGLRNGPQLRSRAFGCAHRSSWRSDWSSRCFPAGGSLGVNRRKQAPGYWSPCVMLLARSVCDHHRSCWSRRKFAAR